MNSKTSNIFTFITLAVLFMLPSCSKFQDLAAFDVSYTIPRTSFTYVPTTVKSEEQLLFSGAVTANLDSIMNANGVSSGIVGETKFTKLTITIAEPEDVTFNWLISARGEISQSADFLSVQEIGYVTNNDPLAKSVVLTLNNVNIRPYLGARLFYVRIYGVVNLPIPSDWIKMYIEGKMVMHIEPL